MKSSSGTEAPRTVNTERLQPTRAASTLAEVSAFQNGVGKFADTMNNFEQLKKVIDLWKFCNIQQRPTPHSSPTSCTSTQRQNLCF